MVHLIMLVENYPWMHEKTAQFFKEFKPPSGITPIVREVRLYDVGFYESDLPYMLKEYLKYEKAIENSHLGLKHLNRIAKWVRLLFPALKPVDKNIKIEGERAYKNKFLYIYIIGKIEDRYNEKGIEVI